MHQVDVTGTHIESSIVGLARLNLSSLYENLDGAHNRRNKQTGLIIMDFVKAFDKVPHRRLACKLE